MKIKTSVFDMKYPADIREVENGLYFVSFADVPEALTQGHSYEDALEMAVDALAVALSFYHEDGRPLPIPSLPTGEQVLITVSE